MQLIMHELLVIIIVYISDPYIHVGSISGGVQYIKSVVGDQFTEPEMREALQHTDMNAQTAVDYLLTKGNCIVM